jgi:hypothetical protein
MIGEKKIAISVNPRIQSDEQTHTMISEILEIQIRIEFVDESSVHEGMNSKAPSSVHE